MDEEGLSPREATRKAMTQIGGAMIGVTAVLTAVFVPMAFFPGGVGGIYRQFSVAMIASMLVSSFMAMSLTPALCANLLKPTGTRRISARPGAACPASFARCASRFAAGFDRASHGYRWLYHAHRRNVSARCSASMPSVRCVRVSLLEDARRISADRRPGANRFIPLPAGSTQQRTHAVSQVEQILTRRRFAT